MIDIPFIATKEKFLVLELGPKLARASLLELNEDKHIRRKKAWVADSLASIAKKIRYPKDAAVIVSVHGGATTSLIPVSLKREYRDQPLGALELENLLSQAIGKVFNQCREKAGKELGLADIDVVLANSRVVRFKVDGHGVLNPLGFRGEKIEAMMELIFTERDLLEGVKEFLHKRRTFFLTERGHALFKSVQGSRPGMVGFLDVGQDKVSLVLQNGEGFEKIALAWTPKIYLGAIKAKFGVSDRAAQHMYKVFLASDVSPHMRTALERLLKPVTTALFKELPQKTCTLYVRTGTKLPFLLPVTSTRRTLETVREAELVSRFGLTLDQELDIATLAPFLEFYYDKSDSTINRWLRRHLNWLGAPSLVG